MSYTLSIGSTTYDVYADEAYAATYLAASFHADSWATATDLKKQQSLVTSTRLLDRQNWQGDKASDSQPLAWPRSGVTNDTPDSTVIPDEVSQACCELALALIDGSTVQNDQSTANAVQSAGAGSARVSFFRGAEGAPYRFSLIVQELIGQWLQGSNASTFGTESFDVDDELVDNDFSLV